MTKADERQKRLSQALRQNLLRRKAQARGEAVAETAPRPEALPNRGDD